MSSVRNVLLSRMLLIVALIIVMLGTFIAIPHSAYASATSSQRVIWPVDTLGEPWKIISGYAGGDHVGYTLYGIDIARQDGEAQTLAATIKSPVSGTIQYDGAARYNVGQCVFILIDGTSDLKIALCHLNFSSDIWNSSDHTKVNRGMHVVQNQTDLGSIAQDVVNGSGNTHLHMNLYTEQGTNPNTRQAVPFTGLNHIGECGDFTPNGTVNQWVGNITCGKSTSSALTINFSVKMQDIGTSNGDNNNPQHPSRQATIQILDANNSAAATIQSTVTYSSSTGVYSGSVSTSLTPGAYTARVRMSNTLYKGFPGFFTVPTGTVNEPTVTPLSGDINADGQLDILDYNILIGCYGSKSGTSSCKDKVGSDLNDNGSVDGVDYNQFLRNMQTQHGS